MRLQASLNGPRGTLAALAVAVVVAIVVLLNAILLFAWAEESRAQRLRGEAAAAQVSVGLSTYLRQMQAQADRLATSPWLLEAAENGSPDAVAGAEKALLAQVPALHSAKVLPLESLGIAAPGFRPDALLNNLEVHLAGEAFGGRVASPEAFPHAGGWLVSVASRIATPGGESRGVVVLRASLATILESFILPGDAAGEYSLRATKAADGSGSIHSAGAAPAPEAETYTAPTSLEAVQAGFRPTGEFLESGRVSGVGLLAPTALGGLAVLVLLLFGFRQLRTQLQQDVARLRDLVLYQRSTTASAPRLHFEELAPLAETLSQQRREAAAPVRRVRDGEAAPAVARPEESALEIELTEEPEPAPPAPEPEPATPAIPESIFRDYDIRGSAALLSPALVESIGRAIGSEAIERGSRTIAVGADGRETSPALREQLVRGLVESGVEVIDAGTVATPMLYFAAHRLAGQTGVMVTGSHNPADQNGFKIMIAGETLCGDRISALRARIAEGRFTSGRGSYRVTRIDEEYVNAVCEDVLVDKPFRVVVDCGNGAASVVAVELFRQLGCEVFPLFCELDGRFPNHAPDPAVPSNLRHLLSEVAARHADLGIAFDGDGDRIGVVTASGRIVSADRLLMLFARDLLSRQPGADIVFDVKCSRDLSTVISQSGGRPIMWRSGHSWIKQKMKETGALLGGEYTGHICFRDRWLGFDDALYCAGRLLEVLSAEEQSLDELLGSLPRAVGTPEIRIEVPEERKFVLMARVAEGFAPQGARLIRIDGVRAEFSSGWGLVRASNTSAALVCRFEAQDDRALERVQAACREELARLLPEFAIPF